MELLRKTPRVRGLAFSLLTASLAGSMGCGGLLNGSDARLAASSIGGLFGSVSDAIGGASQDQIINVDILFVVDTSSSYEDNRREIASEIDTFISAVPSGWDVQFGVLPAHGPSSSAYGDLFESSSSEGAIIPMNLNHSKNEARAKVCQKFRGLTSDASTDGGEAGLLALHGFINSGSSLKDQFLRDQSYQLYVFLSDENDLCHPQSNSTADELAAYQTECQTLGNVGAFDPNSMIDNLYASDNAHAVSFAAVVGLDSSLLPASPELEEFGNGYYQMIEAAKALEYGDKWPETRGFFLDLQVFSPPTGSPGDEFCNCVGTECDGGIGV